MIWLWFCRSSTSAESKLPNPLSHAETLLLPPEDEPQSSKPSEIMMSGRRTRQIHSLLKWQQQLCRIDSPRPDEHFASSQWQH